MIIRGMSQVNAARAVVIVVVWAALGCGSEEAGGGSGFIAQGGIGGATSAGAGDGAGSAGIGSAGTGTAGAGGAGTGVAGIGGAGTGSAGAIAAGSGGMNGGAGGDVMAAGGGGMAVAGQGGGGTAGASVTPAGPGDPYSAAQCIEVVAATLSTPECAECICNSCLDLINICRTDPDPSSNPNSTMTQGQQCEAVLLCGNENNCYGQLCYYGPCIFQIQESFTGGMPNTSDETTMGHPLYNATAAANCKADKCADACAGNPEMQ